MRSLMALLLSVALVFSPVGAKAEPAPAPRPAHTRLHISPAYLALGVATLVTGARIVAVLFAGNTIFGGRLGTGLLVVYLAHVVVEGAVYGAGAGASALVMGHDAPEADPEGRPTLRPERLGEPVPSSRLPLQVDSRRYR